MIVVAARLLGAGTLRGCAIVMLFLHAPASVSAQEHPLAARAREIAAARAALPASAMRVVATGSPRASDPVRVKVLDPKGGITLVMLDAEGQELGPAALERRRQAHRGEPAQKLAPMLQQRLRTAPGTTMDVAYLLEPPAADGNRDLGIVRRRMAAAQRRLVAELQARGARIKHQARYAPIVIASATSEAIQGAAALAEVSAVQLEQTFKPVLDVSKAVTQATTVQGRGIDGTGVRVAVVEQGRIGSHPSLPTSRRILCRPAASRETSAHKTAMAGIIQSTSSRYTGQAPRVTLIDAIAGAWTEAELMAAADCAIEQGASAINMSFGNESDGSWGSFARYVDATAYNTGRTFVVAAGNECSLRTGEPAIGFNDLTVGSFDDRNTARFSDDRHGCDTRLPASERHSTWQDPPSPNGDREEPNIVAPGVDIITTCAGDSICGSSRLIRGTGTSLAAPHVTGLIALLQDRAAGLRDHGERMRAIVMASARHNIEGATRLSDRDGAGAIMDAAADQVLVRQQSWTYLTGGGAAGFPIQQPLYAGAGHLVRVALVWSTKAPGAAELSEPTTDLDLIVLDPEGNPVGSSASLDNAFEIVRFTAPVSGTYTARISNARPSPGAEQIGLAVSRFDR